MTSGCSDRQDTDAVVKVRACGPRGLTAIWKHPVDGRVSVWGVNLRGHDRADPKCPRRAG